jgi:hypothetical protein
VLKYGYLKCEEMNFYEITSDGYIESNISRSGLRGRESTGTLSIEPKNESQLDFDASDRIGHAGKWTDAR